MGRPEEVPRVLSHDRAKALLEQHGWVATIGGKHSTKMTKRGERPITLPRHKGRDYGKGLTAQILRQAGLKGTAEQDDEQSESASGE